jgi:hypothetical protein
MSGLMVSQNFCCFFVEIKNVKFHRACCGIQKAGHKSEKPPVILKINPKAVDCMQIGKKAQ